jgi:nitroimidazol reductase NimA-like FMN-containing flavoprotein (pyridoxamine 5'-phosphate oxidase superfamily)
VPRQELVASEKTTVLAKGRIVRIAFRDGESSYLIPFGYVWLNGAMYGVTEAGRKIQLSEANPTVAFQVDTSLQTGIWEWESVTGTGSFEIAGAEERSRALAALQPAIAEAPDWWRHEQAPRMAAGVWLVWKLTPTKTSGCRYAPPRDPAE